jgi:hypothetical protein
MSVYTRYVCIHITQHERKRDQDLKRHMRVYIGHMRVYTVVNICVYTLVIIYLHTSVIIYLHTPVIICVHTSVIIYLHTSVIICVHTSVNIPLLGRDPQRRKCPQSIANILRVKIPHDFERLQGVKKKKTINATTPASQMPTESCQDLAGWNSP